ncbi:MAG: P-II family nitrogen regulator [Smithella sp.]|jgi:nitrogen regulatory protein P-II 1
MKFIIAIIPSYKLKAVKRELEAMEVNLMTVTSAVYQRRQKNVKDIYVNAEETSGLLNKVRLDIAINEDFVEPTIEAIVKGASIDAVSEDRIFVF